MMRFWHFTFFIVTFLLFLFTIEHVSAKAIEQKKYESLENQGLYNASDHVVILNVTNFKSSVYGSKSSWLVEFYSSWCGHCRRYVPIWKALARNILLWRDVVIVSAINCADEQNSPICQEYDIMKVPTIKYFSVDAKPGSMGLVMEKGKDVANMRNILVKQLQIEQQEGRGTSWPNIVPYRKNDLESVWEGVKEDIKYVFLIFEAPDSYVGSEVILDFQKVHDFHIRRVTSENELLCVTAKVTKFPSLILLQRDGSQKSISIKAPTREGVRQSIQDYMASIGIHIELPDTTKNISKPAHMDHTEPEPPQNPVDQFGDVIFQLDLEKTLRYSLLHEIPLTKTIDGEKMLALKAYLKILASYFPIRGNGVSYLSALYNATKKKENITGESFHNLVSNTEEKMTPIYSGNLEWIGCRGSSEIYRGYPCGLWTMFHMLTVNFDVQNFDQVDHDPAKVLRAMYGYIKNFFSCAECSQHFVEMANRSKIFEVKNKDESILWLWRAHNEVNKRLAGDTTEDPQHKKIQYPAEHDCPLCRDENGNWKEDAVLLYLKKKYGHEGINFYGTTIKLNQDSQNSTKTRKKRGEYNNDILYRYRSFDNKIRLPILTR